MHETLTLRVAEESKNLLGASEGGGGGRGRCLFVCFDTLEILLKFEFGFKEKKNKVKWN